MRTPIEVRMLGPSLLCRAVEALLANSDPIYGENNPGGRIGTGDAGGGSGATTATRRASPGGSAATVILLVGDGWQSRVRAGARMPRRGAAGPAAPPPRYALIAEGTKIDFYGARKMAVNAFVGTDEPFSILAQGIQAAAANRLYCSPQLLPALIEAVGTGAMGDGAVKNGGGGGGNGDREPDVPASQAALLSAREHEVALHAARGLSNEQIAVFLGISIPTVKFHLMHAFRKLDIQRRTQLYAYMPYFTSATEALLPK